MPPNRLKRVGLVVPAPNPTVEPEVRRLLPPELAVHATRLPLLAGDLQARNDALAAHYPAAVKSFGTLQLDAIFLGATGPTYALGAVRERELAARLSGDAGAPVETANLAILNTLRSIDAAGIVLIAPYPDWLMARAVAYWEGAGIRVAQVIPMAGEPRGYKVGTADVHAALRKAQAPAGGAVIFGGAGMATLDAIATALPEFEVPLLSANLCGAWRIAMRLGARPGADLARAAPALAARLPAPRPTAAD